MKTVDPFDPANHDKPLWVVYGHDCFPKIVCLKVNCATGKPCVWGYSVYKCKPGFRTIGISLDEFMKREESPRFFDSHGEAIMHLIELTTPRIKD